MTFKTAAIVSTFLSIIYLKEEILKNNILEVRRAGMPPSLFSTCVTISFRTEPRALVQQCFSSPLCCGDERWLSHRTDCCIDVELKCFILVNSISAHTLPPEPRHVAMIFWLTPLAPVFTHAVMQGHRGGSMWDAFRSVMESCADWVMCLLGLKLSPRCGLRFLNI